MAKAPWIAIVDDDPSVLKALTRSLRVRGFATRVYGSAHEFLAALSDGLPGCLIVDLQMPEMTSLELLQHLKRQGLGIPVIVISAHGDVGVPKHCESAGAIAFLPKPWRNASLSPPSMPRPGSQATITVQPKPNRFGRGASSPLSPMSARR